MAPRDDQIVIKIILDDGSVKKALIKTQDQAKITGQKITKNVGGAIDQTTVRVGKTSQAFAGLAKNVLGLAAAFISIRGIFAGARVTAELQTSLKEISTITNDVKVTTDEFRDSLIDLSGEFGTSAQDQARSFYQIVSAGVTDATTAQNLLITANKLAIGGLTDVQGAIDVLTSVTNAYGIENLSAARASDILFATVRLGKTRIEDLQSSIGLVAPTAQALGLSFEEVAGTIAKLTTVLPTTALAVTGLNAVFTALFKKQGEARKLGVAKEFSIQALQAKGLAVFLRDLTKALGGSETKLTQLLGRVEGSKAILALGRDDFVGLADSIEQIKDSAGATQAAFDKLSATLGVQFRRLGSILVGAFLKLTSGELADSATKLLTTLNNSLTIFFSNIDRAIKQLLARIALFGTVLVLIFKRVALKKAIASLILSIRGIGISFVTLRAQGVGSLRALTVAMNTTRIATKALRIGITTLKAVVSFGLLLALDELIQSFIKVREEGLDAFSSLGFAFKTLALTIIELQLPLARALNKAFLVPDSVIANLEALQARLKASIDKTNESLKKQAALLSSSKKEEEAEEEEDPKVFKLKESFEQLKNISALTDVLIQESFNNIIFGMDDTSKKFEEFLKKVQLGTVTLGETLKFVFAQQGPKFLKSFAGAAAKGFQAFGKALATGEDAAKAIGASMLQFFGDALTQLGTQLIATGLALLLSPLTASEGAATILAGVGVAAAGGILSGLAAAKGAAGAGGAATGAGGTEPALVSDEAIGLAEPEDRAPDTSVQIIVEGNILDRRETGLELAKVLNEAFGSTGIRITG